MTFAKLKSLALAMSEEERDATLKQLCNDPRGAAVLKLILDEKEQVSDTMATREMCERPNLLARAAGGRFLCMELEGRLSAACTPEKPKRKVAAPPASSEE